MSLLAWGLLVFPLLGDTLFHAPVYVYTVVECREHGCFVLVLPRRNASLRLGVFHQLDAIVIVFSL